MSNAEQLPTCDHTNCDHMKRLEYCEIEGRDPEGGSLINIGMIEHLMYLHGDFERGIRYTHDGNVRFISRNFTFQHPDSDTLDSMDIETCISFLHEYHAERNYDRYSVKIGWRPIYDGATEQYYETFYTIEQWPSLTYATMDEYNLKTEQLRTNETPIHASRAMTDYDHEVLFNTLSDVDTYTQSTAINNANT